MDALLSARRERLHCDEGHGASTMSTAALQSQMERLDRIINRRLGEEGAALKRADASLEDARRAKMRDNAEARRLIAQTYDDAFRSFGVTTPEPADDEAPSAFRKRLFNRLARKLPPDHDLAQLRADDLGSQPIVFDNFETELIKAATAEGQRPSIDNLPDDGSLVARHRTDSATGERMTEFFGRRSFIADMGRPGRQVERIVDRNSGHAIWGKPF
jgi:hypothetical protein